MKQVISTLVSVVLWTVVALLLLLVMSGLYQRFFSKEKYTGFFGIGYAVVVSGSMEPVMHINDMIFFQEHPKSDYRVGDVIVFVREEGDGSEILVTHRIISRDGKTLVTKGDANNTADDPIGIDQVIGRVVLRIPGVGKAVSFLQNRYGVIVLMALIAALAGFNIFLTLHGRKRKRVRTVSGKEEYLRY